MAEARLSTRCARLIYGPFRDSNYTLEDHPHIAGGAMTEFFDAFRKEVLALDPV